MPQHSAFSRHVCPGQWNGTEHVCMNISWRQAALTDLWQLLQLLLDALHRVSDVAQYRPGYGVRSQRYLFPLPHQGTLHREWWEGLQGMKCSGMRGLSREWVGLEAKGMEWKLPNAMWRDVVHSAGQRSNIYVDLFTGRPQMEMKSTQAWLFGSTQIATSF